MKSNTSISDRCQGQWFSILSSLGVAASVLNKRNQACPMCGGKDRFRWTNHEERGGYFCNGCGHGDGFDFVQAYFKLDFREAAQKVESVIGSSIPNRPPQQAHDSGHAAMRSLWNKGLTISEDDPVGRYLSRRRLRLSSYPRCLRHVASLRHEDGAAPGMIAQVVGPDGRAANIHRTWLTLDGCKAELDPCRKLMKGGIPDGSAIRLFAAGPVLGIAEGIETAIAAHIRFGVPVWAVISEGGMQKFRPPAGVERLMIFGDNDRSHVGQAAAYIAARDVLRWAERQALEIAVTVHLPETPGSDWADDMPEILRKSAMIGDKERLTA